METEEFSIDFLPNPFEINIWGTDVQLTQEAITAVMDIGYYETHPIEIHHHLMVCHAARIAYFVNNPPEDPIEISWQQTPDGELYLWCIDGCHRIAAAIFRGEKTILARWV